MITPQIQGGKNLSQGTKDAEWRKLIPKCTVSWGRGWGEEKQQRVTAERERDYGSGHFPFKHHIPAVQKQLVLH